jgi:YesN/AraC family two-component response regulator
MDIIEVSSLPQIQFAHVYSSAKYKYSFDAVQNFIEVTYISEGTVTISTGSSKEVLSKGDIICHLYNTPLSIDAQGYHEHHTVAATVNLNCLTDTDGLYLPLVTKASSSTIQICNTIDEFIHDPLYYKTNRIKGASKFLDLLCMIDECNIRIRERCLPSAALYTQKAKEYIQKNIHSPITQKDVANHLGISSEYLCSVFKKAEGITLIKYCNLTKLKEMKLLIDREGLMLSEVTAMFGYNDPNYVSRLFKNTFGYNITKK